MILYYSYFILYTDEEKMICSATWMEVDYVMLSPNEMCS